MLVIINMVKLINIPRGKTEIAVEEEKDHKDHRGSNMCGFKELIKAVPNTRQGHDSQVGLSEQSDDTCPINDTGLPLLDHVAFPDVIYNIGKGVNQSQNEHGVAGPMMENLKLLMRDASQDRDHICFGAQGSIG